MGRLERDHSHLCLVMSRRQSIQLVPPYQEIVKVALYHLLPSVCHRPPQPFTSNLPDIRTRPQALAAPPGRLPNRRPIGRTFQSHFPLSPPLPPNLCLCLDPTPSLLHTSWHRSTRSLCLLVSSPQLQLSMSSLPRSTWACSVCQLTAQKTTTLLCLLVRFRHRFGLVWF